MKLLIMGDLHLRVRTPEKRTEDDFLALCLDKLEQVIDVAISEGCEAILQPGDFFDSPQPSGELVAAVIRLILMKEGPPILCVHGQHDLLYHTEAAAKRSALQIMAASGAVHLLGPSLIRSDVEKGDPAGMVLVYGADFGAEPPKAPDRTPGDGTTLVLVAHASVGDKPLWPGHALTGPAEYVKKHPGYDLYVLGDYHYAWTWGRRGGPQAVDAGCLIRKVASEREIAHRPAVYIFDVKTRGLERREVVFDPPETAFDLSKVGVEVEDPKRFTDFTDRLRSQGKIGVDFDKNLQAWFDLHGTQEAVRAAAWGSLEKKDV